MRAVERIYRAEAMKYLASGKTSITCSALLSTSYLSEKGEVYPLYDLGQAAGQCPRLQLRPDAAHRGRSAQGHPPGVIDQEVPQCLDALQGPTRPSASPGRALLALVHG